MVVTRMNTPPVLEPPEHMFVLVALPVKHPVVRDQFSLNRTEPSRVSRRLLLVRRSHHEQDDEQIFT